MPMLVYEKWHNFSISAWIGEPLHESVEDIFVYSPA